MNDASSELLRLSHGPPSSRGEARSVIIELCDDPPPGAELCNMYSLTLDLNSASLLFLGCSDGRLLFTVWSCILYTAAIYTVISLCGVAAYTLWHFAFYLRIYYA